eukprot:SAG11_NODE_4031_length_2098_cov_1.247624_3_plen_288_part_00
MPSDGPVAGVKILGLPHGRPEFVQQFLRTIVAATATACDAIRDLAAYEHAGATQAAYVLLQYCAQPRFVHVLRSLSPADTLACATAHDSVIMTTFTRILGVGDALCLDATAANPDWWQKLADVARQHAALPHREGGFALMSAVAVSSAFYVGGMTRVCQIVNRDEHSAFPAYIKSLPSTLHTSALEPLCHLRDAWDLVARAIRVPNVAASTTMEATCGARSVRHLLEADPHTQRLLTHAIASSLRLQLLSSVDAETRARLVSCNGYGATAHLRAIHVRWNVGSRTWS